MNSAIEKLNQLADTWWQFVLHATWQAALVGVVVLLVVGLGRRWPSPVRFWILMIVLVKFSFPPFVSSPTGLFSWYGPRVRESQQAAIGDSIVMETKNLRDSMQLQSTRTDEYSPTLNRDTNEDVVDEKTRPTESSINVLDIDEPDLARQPVVSPPIDKSEVERTNSPPNPDPPPTHLTVKSWLMIVHAAGCLFVIAWTIRELSMLRSIIRRARRIRVGTLFEQFNELREQIGVSRRTQLVISDEIQTPVAFGILRPIVMLPDAACGKLEKRDLKAVLGHELAHHRRGDAWTNWAQVMVCAVWWFHPIAWLVNGALRRVREDCCDDLLIAEDVTNKQEYCETLLRVASHANARQQTSVALSMISGRHPLARRLIRIMDPSRRRTARLSLRGLALIVALALVVVPGLHCDEMTVASDVLAAVANVRRDSVDSNIEKSAPDSVAEQPGDSNSGNVKLKSGLSLWGKPKRIAMFGDEGVAARINPVVVVDDEVRRVYVPANRIAMIADDPADELERFAIEQRVAMAGRRISGVGPLVRETPWDEFGRRLVAMHSSRGNIDIVQGITEITARHARVQGLMGRSAFVWEMRISTNSISRTTLSKILRRQIDEKDSSDRLRLVRLYIQAERFRDAMHELNEVIKDFPKLGALEKQVTELRNLNALRLLDEAVRRRGAGQHKLAYKMLLQFPSKGVDGATLVKVRDLLDEYKETTRQHDQVVKRLGDLISQLKDDGLRAQVQRLYGEIKADASYATLPRFAEFSRSSSDRQLSVQQKISLAVSGWIAGPASMEKDLAGVMSLVETRNLVRDYAHAVKTVDRKDIVDRIKKIDGASPRRVAQVLAAMMPPLALPPATDTNPDFYRMTIPRPASRDARELVCWIQLPPEYDPYRRYPCIVSLHGLQTTAVEQVEWWAGRFDEQTKTRRGHATRNGYVVIAPEWTTEDQKEYGFSARVHSAAVKSLRQACQRVSIDADRVFLSGHDMGGDAAWDIGLAHPDLWAGVIMFNATAHKYISRYWENGRGLPLYFVNGELDGNRIERNRMDWNRYLRRSGLDAMVVQFQGRGSENYQEEIANIFSWMNQYRRELIRKEFRCVSMRPWDRSFWWVELDRFPENSMVQPVDWPGRGKSEALTGAAIRENNVVQLKSIAAKTTVWLTPSMVDFGKPITINGVARDVSPSIEVMLEDVRKRADRQHPFWASVTME